mgnify:CR=1 FL=1
MARDFIQAEEIIDAVIAELQSHLPATWFLSGRAAGEEPLALLEHGDLVDYSGNDRELMDQLPAIFVRPLDVTPIADGAGVGGVDCLETALRLVHVRGYKQCYDNSGNAQDNQTRARSRYAKIITKALFADSHGKMGSPTLTTTDSGGVELSNVDFVRWDLGSDLASGTTDVQIVRRMQQNGARIWAIACDLVAQVVVGPP